MDICGRRPSKCGGPGYIRELFNPNIGLCYNTCTSKSPCCMLYPAHTHPYIRVSSARNISIWVYPYTRHPTASVYRYIFLVISESFTMIYSRDSAARKQFVSLLLALACATDDKLFSFSLPKDSRRAVWKRDEVNDHARDELRLAPELYEFVI